VRTTYDFIPWFKVFGVWISMSFGAGAEVTFFGTRAGVIKVTPITFVVWFELGVPQLQYLFLSVWSNGTEIQWFFAKRKIQLTLASWNRNVTDVHKRTRRGGGRTPRVWKILGQLWFSGQALVAQKSWIKKNTYSVQWIQGTLCFSGQAQVTQKSWM